jgi:hypothetical protein
LAPNHDLFNKPYKVDVEYATEPSPDVYRLTAGNQEVPPTLQLWQVQFDDLHSSWDPANPEAALRPGMVADGRGFADSPDCEVISGGLNGKSLNAVAIARQASFLFWGFDSPPSNATDSAKLAFVNGIVYISKFDGAPVLARTVAMSREWAHLQAKDLIGPDSYPFLRSQGRGFVVDEDAKALGLPNNSLDLIEKCVALLEKGEDVERAQRLLERYTPFMYTQAIEWRRWLDSSRDDLFFTDVGGFKWLSKAGPEESVKKQMLALDVPVNDVEPVNMVASIVADPSPQPGSTVLLAVRASIADGWHVYATSPQNSPYPAARFEVELHPGAGFVDEEWTLPKHEPMEGYEDTTVYRGDVVFLRRVRLPDQIDGTLEFPVTVNWQACDPLRCLPPGTMSLVASLTAR